MRKKWKWFNNKLGHEAFEARVGLPWGLVNIALKMIVFFIALFNYCLSTNVKYLNMYVLFKENLFILWIFIQMAQDLSQEDKVI